jgi:hypothetical protein
MKQTPLYVNVPVDSYRISLNVSAAIKYIPYLLDEYMKLLYFDINQDIDDVKVKESTGFLLLDYENVKVT